MKLIDKIQQATSGKPDDYSRIYNPTAKVIEKIANEFAIEFAEWCLVNNVYKSETFDLDLLFLCGLQKYDEGTDKIHYLDELLEIFKKEKGL